MMAWWVRAESRRSLSREPLSQVGASGAELLHLPAAPHRPRQGRRLQPPCQASPTPILTYTPPNLTANGPTPSTTPHRCNFDHLVAYAAQHQRCPVFGCDSHLSRKRFVVRDESLRAALAEVAPTPQHQWAWVRGDEVRLSPPDNDDARADPFGQAGSSATAPTSKRQRLVAGLDSLAASSAGKRRASGQQGSHAAAAAAANHPRDSSADVAVKMEPEGAQIVDGLSEDNSDIYDVERILGERWRGGRAQFLIRWLGCAPPMPRLLRPAACCVLRVR